ncbi:tetratricopeptide repeat protein [Bacillus sp. ISL-51]|uniref:response regulator aspartate phosphatase n=1 Tax=Bacteria TaxID=2 RepID=UPI001BEA1CB4|nr:MULTISPECIES: tetratricopeptide repeat protein [Bacteria]MBT2574640.1 tetratricopeptide repeat protein [Bacillus sp. ISL-51]MBT2711326.1 tetratricopeptide repeat protein [Pseudomonas sp. ISL-88]
MKSKIPSEEVAVKMNEWYKLIRAFEADKAETLKREIEYELEDMEENQDLLLYFSLMEFRHRIMLDKLKPMKENDSQPPFSDMLTEIEMNQQKLTGLLEYYFYYFRGMYEFKQKNFISAISHYKHAEEKLEYVEDDIEKAEFLYKISEVYYHIKQTFFSMNYAGQALDIYKKYELYGMRRVQCKFIIAGNLMDAQQHEKALEYLECALEHAERLDDDYMIAAAHYNIGHCMYSLGDFCKAADYFEKAAAVFEAHSFQQVIQAVFSLTHIYFKAEKYSEAAASYERGIKSAADWGDDIYLTKFCLIKELYGGDGGQDLLKELFDKLESKQLLADTEELLQDAAHFFHKRENYKAASYFFSRLVDVQKRLQMNTYA